MAYKRVLLGLLMVGVLALAAVAGWGLVGRSQAAPPVRSSKANGMTVPYAGRLSDQQGQPVADGAYDFAFALYAAETGGRALWQETQTGVPLQGGSFRVQLGSVTAISEQALFANGAWLSVAVRGSAEEDFTPLEPRQPVNRATVVDSGVSAAAGLACPHDHMGETWTAADPDENGLAIWTVSGHGLLAWSSSSIGVAGISQPTKYDLPAAAYGVYGYSRNDHGVYGKTDGDWSYHSGVYGEASQANANGVTGWNTNSGPGVYAYGKSGPALYAKSEGDRGVYAARFYSQDGNGIYAQTGASHGYAAYFSGDVTVTGNLSKPGGGFKIDHPLDPAHKYLNHSFVESPDRKNLYDGMVVLDADGAAWVALPEWFEAVNQGFGYQLTPIGAPAPGLYIAREVEDNRFRIAGGEPGLKVSWQVTGIRHDAWAEAHPLPVEQAKPPEEQGSYLHPAEHDQSKTLGLDYQQNPPLDQFESGGE